MQDSTFYGNFFTVTLQNNITVSGVLANYDVNRLQVGSGGGGVFLYSNGYIQGNNLLISSQFGSGGNATIGNNLSVGNKLTVIGNAVFSSNLSVTGAANISNIFTGNANMSGYANISGNVTAGNIDGGNLITANFVAGDGYLLTNLTIAAGTALVNGNSNIVVEPNANITVSSNGVQDRKSTRLNSSH